MYHCHSSAEVTVFLNLNTVHHSDLQKHFENLFQKIPVVSELFAQYSPLNQNIFLIDYVYAFSYAKPLSVVFSITSLYIVRNHFVRSCSLCFLITTQFTTIYYKFHSIFIDKFRPYILYIYI